MIRLERMSVILLIGGALLLPFSPRLHAQDDKDQSATSSDKQADKQDTGKKKNDGKKNLKKLEKELATPYKKWLEEEVPYIITDEERSAFLQLQTNEEREQFIEAFWQRRDPTPDTVENEFKEEHYRRIAYANERFSSGIPGWRTDRGRIYIMWGPPDSIESHSAGSTYDRPMTEGGGQTTVYGFDDWNYHYMEGIGENITIEFVDPTGTGEYHITMDPGEKDAMAHVPGGGPSLLESMGLSTQAQRFTQSNGSTAPLGSAQINGGGGLESQNEFSRLEQFAKVQAPPPVKFKDLEEVVSSRILRNQITFDYRFDFMRITGDTILVPVTVQIQNKQMTFRDHDGVQSASLNLFGRISSMTGRVIQTFEDVIQRDFPDALLEPSLKGFSIYQKAIPLRPGLYKLDLVIKDVNSGNVGVINTRLAVSPIPDDKLEASSLILADQMEPVSSKDVGVGQFVLGSTKVRPKLDAEFHTDQPLDIYLQFYNLKVDDKTHKNNVSLDFKISQGTQVISHEVKTGEQLGQGGEQITVQQTIAPKTLAPGKYKLEIQATDQVANQTVTRTAEFTVTPPAMLAKVATNGATGR
ncbi:MAG TPA: GWxTD domain-containing protein [Candidatus Saccharimonadales bacterium]|jgi:GWxTD domain-containing protein|nr:GWxTD domain-containing protein [Candidatus Saccharimonadales bacterium]